MTRGSAVGRTATRLTIRWLGVVVAGALLAGAWSPAAALAPPSGGTFTPDQAAGTDLTEITAVTNGTCDVPGPPDMPVDGYNAVVAGPGAFAPNPAEGSPDGPAIVSTDNAGFSTTQPIRFPFRGTFRELAQERNATLQPGEYVVTFRCVNQLFGTVFQTFTATFTFTGGPPATAFTVTAPPPVGPLPAGPSPADVPTSAPAPSSLAVPSEVAADPRAGSTDTAAPALIALVALIGIAVVGAVIYRTVRRRSPERR